MNESCPRRKMSEAGIVMTCTIVARVPAARTGRGGDTAARTFRGSDASAPTAQRARASAGAGSERSMIASRCGERYGATQLRSGWRSERA